jgi:hypothetical protein
VNSVILTDKTKYKEIEFHLRNYKTYCVALKNIAKQIEYFYPNITSNIPEVNYYGIKLKRFSKTEDTAIKNLESPEVQKMRKEMEKYKIIVQSIDSSLEIMEKDEKEFIQNRYFKNYSIKKTAIEMHYTEKHIFSIRKRVMDKLGLSLSGILCYFSGY